MTPRTTTTWLWAVLVALAATALLSTAWHLSSLEPRRGNTWHTLTRWRTSDPLAYRRQIQLATTQPRDPEPAFDHVYVLSLPAREDRRADMRQLAQALAIDITFVDAADKEEPFLQWIAERVAESRKLRRQVMVRGAVSLSCVTVDSTRTDHARARRLKLGRSRPSRSAG